MENLLSNSDTKIVGIVKHPCGVIKSWMRAPKEFDENWDISEEWRFAEKKNKSVHDYYGFKKWLDATELMLQLRKRFPEKFSLVTYENILKNTRSEIVRFFNFCGLSLSDQVETFLKQSTSLSSNDPYDVYRNNKKTDEWKGMLSADIAEEILNDKRFIRIKSRL